jgi:hypothetical protein
MNKDKIKEGIEKNFGNKYGFITLLIFIISWITLLFIYGPQKIVSFVGMRNGYILAFVVATFGGMSAFSSTSFFTTVITLALGGLNPILLGIIGGIGVTIGDSLFFYFGIHGRCLFPNKIIHKLDTFFRWLEKGPSLFVPVFVFLYAGFTPFPNELMTIPLGLIGIEYKEIILPLLIGNMVLITIILFLAIHGVSFLI